jgi:hypothetical protein
MVLEDLEKLKQFDEFICYSYDKTWFHELNASKVNKIVAFWFDAPKKKACLIGGLRQNRLLFPYSSPFSMIELFKECKNEEMEAYIDEIERFCIDSLVDDVYFVLPPFIYDQSNISKWLGALLRKGFEVYELGLNFQMEITTSEEYVTKLLKNGRKNLNNSLKYDYSLHLCTSESEKKEAYDIIAENRKSKNYYISMTWEEVKRTIDYVEHDFHILSLNGQNIASALIFKVTDSIWQVIYWGELPRKDEMRPMNYLPYALNNYYHQKGIKYLDIGPSMWNGKPNYGLCDYKESIGCSISSKFILRKEYNK